jgi:hypothetical protein
MKIKRNKRKNKKEKKRKRKRKKNTLISKVHFEIKNQTTLV